MSSIFEFLTGESKTFILFFVVAVIRTLLDLALWQFLVYLLERNKELLDSLLQRTKLNQYAIAQVIAFIVSVIISYASNRNIFGGDSSFTYQVTTFIIVAVVALVASVWTIEVLTTNTKILKKVEDYKLINKHWPMIAKIASSVITLVINYLGYRFIVFR